MPSQDRRWQIRAQGLCWACLQPMDDNDRRLMHRECQWRVSHHWKVTEIRHAVARRLAQGKVAGLILCCALLAGCRHTQAILHVGPPLFVVAKDVPDNALFCFQVTDLMTFDAPSVLHPYPGCYMTVGELRALLFKTKMASTPAENTTCSQ